MGGTSRREFLGLAAGSLAGVAASQLLPGAIAKALAIEPSRRTASIEDVEHVVVLMQENRSFDHYFGGLRGVRGYGDPRPHLLPNGKPVWFQPPATVKQQWYQNRGLPADAEFVLPFPVDARRTSEHIAGTNHGWGSGVLLWNQGRYDGWVNQKQDVFTMAYQQRSELPYHFALAEAFTLCDAYYCSVPADTAPNRIFLWSGTIDPRNRLGTRPNGPGLWERHHTNGYTWTTYPERLQKAGVSWKVYQGGSGIPGQPTDNFTDNSLEFFANYHVQEGASPSSPLVQLGVSTHTLKEFGEDAVNGKLPQVTWIVPPYQYSEHAAATATDGAYYINLVLEALVANPEVWSKTVLIVNYDENDGLFDHVVPPMPPLANKVGTDGLVSQSLGASLADEILDFDVWQVGGSPSGENLAGKQPLGLGSRVPMIVVSPWSKGGWVCSEVFDHTSVLRFLETRFGVAEPNISAWRRSLCGDLTSAFDFAHPDSKPVTPPVPQPLQSQGQPFSVPSPQTVPVQEPGIRPARPLPYRFTVELDGDRSGGAITLAFNNQGSVGTYFYAQNMTRPADAPRRYTVAARDTVRDTWTRDIATDGNGRYDLLVTGANGHLSRFAGDSGNGAEPRVALRLDKTQLVLEVVNLGNEEVALQVRNAYGESDDRQVRVRSGQTTRATVDTEQSHGWYDVTVTLDGVEGYQRRFAGHMETGSPSFSDPGPHK